MNITLGDEIKINGETIPEYLQQALFENLLSKYGCVALKKSDLDKLSYDKMKIEAGAVVASKIACNHISTSKINRPFA